jgi:hypothetical protein
MRFIISIAALLALFSAPVHGSTITTSATEPTGSVEISQTTLSTDAGSPFEAIRKTAPNNVSAWRELGQTFTVESAFTLDKISLKVSQWDDLPTAGLSLFMNVWTAADVTSFTGTSLAGFPDTGITPTFPTHPANPAPESARVWMTFDVTNLALTPGIYGFTVGFDTVDFAAAYQLGSSPMDIGGIYLNRGGNPYAGGQMFRHHPSNGTSGGGFGDGLSDLAFFLQSAPTGPHPGDFDGDGDVDGADFVAWQTNFPKASGAVLAEGDADGDGDVDGADFVVWQTNFPFTPGSAASPVPEPTSFMLSVAGLAAIGIVFRSRVARSTPIRSEH